MRPLARLDEAFTITRKEAPRLSAEIPAPGLRFLCFLLFKAGLQRAG
jgi:hypothetical protein